MQQPEDSLRNQIALGWVMLLLALITMLQFMIVASVLEDNNLRAIHRDPGTSIKWTVYLVAVYALMPVYVYLVHGLRSRAPRWLAVAVAVVGFVFFLLHHLAHWHFGQRPDFGSHVLDLVLHVIGLWVIVNSIRWARIPATVTV
jgi:steroid 5-alpha reductase family enzyme